MSSSTLPGPRGRLLPTVRLLTKPLEYYRSLIERYGDPVLVRAMNGNIWMTASEEGAKEIVTGRPETYAPFATGALEPLVGRYSLLTLGGREHRRQRKLVMPSFHGQRMRAYADTMIAATERAFGEFGEGDRFVALEQAPALALEVIVRTVFGVEEPAAVARMASAIDATVAALKPIFLFSSGFQRAPFGLGPWARFQRAARELDGLLYDQIMRKRAERGGDDVLGLLVEARDEEGEPMTDQEIRDQLITLLVAGHETSSVSIAWTLHHLHRNPETLQAFRAALDGHDGPADEIARIPWVRATVQESLRLYPIIPDFVRELVEPMEFRGREVPAGDCVGVMSTVLHHAPDIYPDPMRFDPSRWVEEQPPKWAYFPFGAGHRRCVGAAFAEFEIALVVATIVSRLDLELTDPSTVRSVRRNVTMAPSNGVPMRVLGRR